MKLTRFLFVLLTALLLTSLMGQSAFADSDDEFGVSFAPAVVKNIIPIMSISVEGEVRSRDMSRKLERLAIGGYLGFKPISYFKAELGYTFIDQYKTPDVDDQGVHTENYWAPKHELEASLFGFLPIGFLELSVRERYEFTWHHSVNANQWRDGDESKTKAQVKAVKTEHVLRSRVQIAAKIPNSGASLYGSLDVYNDLADGGELFNFRLIFGCNYAIDGGHSVGAYFRSDLFYGVQNNYLLGFKYQYVF